MNEALVERLAWCADAESEAAAIAAEEATAAIAVSPWKRKEVPERKSVVVVFFGAAAETEEHIPGRPSMVQAVALEGGSGVQLPPVEAHSSSLELKSIDSIGVVPLSETGS